MIKLSSEICFDEVHEILGKIPPFDMKKYEKRELKKKKAFKDSEEARTITSKFLDENPHVNVGYVIRHLQSLILSTTKSAEKLGISPNSFARLRKKYNIYPVYTVLNKPNSEGVIKKSFPPGASSFA